MIKQYPRLLAAMGLSLASLAASAIPIAGLVNTGAGGTAGQQDMNYGFSVQAGTATSNGHSYITKDQVGVFPFVTRAWAANDANSKWLTPSANQGANFDTTKAPGQYTWSLTFDLTGDDISTASFDVRWMSDNSSSAYLNGNLLGSTATTTDTFMKWTDSGNVSSGFVPGLNTITFVVNNYLAPPQNPTGVRVEFVSSNVTALPVPEPGTYALMFAGLLGVAGVVRRRRQS